MRRASIKGARSGFTLVEVIAALAIVGLVLANMAIVTRTGSSATRSIAARNASCAGASNAACVYPRFSALQHLHPESGRSTG